MSNADFSSNRSLVLEAMRHKPISDAIADLAAMVESMLAAHEDDGSGGSHGRFLVGLMLKDNLEMLAQRAKTNPAA